MRSEPRADQQGSPQTPVGVARPPNPRSPSLRADNVFVGRHDELAAVTSALAEATQGRPQLVWIEAEAGMGKTALLRQAGLVGTGPGTFAQVQASADATETSLRWGVAGQLLGWGAPGAPSPTPSSDPVSVGGDLLAMFDTVQRRPPGVVIIEDIHHCDLPSAQALLFALRRIQTSEQLLVVVTARPGTTDRLGEGWQRLRDDPGRTTRVLLGGLTSDQVIELAAALGADLAPRVAERIVRHTAGHPLYVRTLLEDVPMAVLASGSATLPVPRSLAAVLLARLHQLSQPARSLVCAAAVAGRPLGLMPLVQIASGPSTDRGEWPQATDTSNRAHRDGRTHRDLADRPHHFLDQALASGLVMEHPDGLVGCRHPLVQAAVIGDLPTAYRTELHRRAAAVLSGVERLGHLVAACEVPDPALAAELHREAMHRRQAGAFDEAADLWLLAAAATDGAGADAAVLAAADALVAGGDRLRASTLVDRIAAAAPSPQRDYLLGCCAFIHGHSEEARHYLAAALAGETDDPRAAGKAATTLALADLGLGAVANVVTLGRRAVALTTDDIGENAQAVTVLALGLAMDGHHDQARRHLGSWLEQHKITASSSRLATGSAGSDLLVPDPDAPAGTAVPGVVDLLVTKGIIELAAGWSRQAAATLRQAVMTVRLGAPGTLGVQALSYLADAEFRLGRWDDAQLHADLAVSVAQDTESVWSYAAAHAVAARIHAWRGNADKADGHQRQAQDAARRYPAWSATAWAAAATATTRLLDGDPHGAISALEPAFDPPTSICLDGVGAEPWIALQADAQVQAGLIVEASATLDQLDHRIAARRAQHRQADHALLDLFRLRAVLAERRGDRETAMAIVQRALELRAKTTDAPLPAARLELAAAQLHRRWQHRREAIGLLHRARREFVRLGCRPLRALADEELRRCGVATDTAIRPAVDLTPQEQAIAHLVVRGHTNRAVAAELFVSVKAVEYHLGNLYAKLGIQNRLQLRQALEPDVRS